MLVLNVGSSSVKWAVARGRQVVFRAVIDSSGPRVGMRTGDGRRFRKQRAAVRSIQAALASVRRLIAERNLQPTIVAHRIVHGGKRMDRPARLTPAVLRYLRGLVPFAPLHQPANLLGVAFSRRAWPMAAQWGVFDTAPFRQLPLHVRTYALPRRLAARLQIERYGFHGTSHAWAFQQAARALRRAPRQCSAVTLHLGAGASMTAWRAGRPIDTTMGFTPLEGLVMATRSGSIDPAIPLFLQTRLGWSAQRVREVLEHESGWFGLTGQRDLRDVLGAAGHPVAGWPRRRWSTADRTRARLALEVYCYHVRRTLAGYLGLLAPAHAIIFTGPVGEHRTIQERVLRDLPAARRIRRVTVRADEEQAIVDAVQKR